MFASSALEAAPQMMAGGPRSTGFGNGGGMEGLTSMFQGLFGHPERPYEDAMNQYREWGNKAEGVQNPFLNAGKGGMRNFQQWLQGQKDPSGFINNLMGQYSESPWAKFQQQQALRASGNQGSASGLNGSTPMAQFEQQNARDISSQDQNQWLQNVLGINTQYGAGQAGLMQGGQHAADSLTGMYGDMGRQMGEQAYNARRAKDMNRAGIWGGAMDIFKNGLFG